MIESILLPAQAANAVTSSAPAKVLLIDIMLLMLIFDCSPFYYTNSQSPDWALKLTLSPFLYTARC